MLENRYLSLNGKIVLYKDANIHVSSVAMKYAASVFEGIRGYWDDAKQLLNLFALELHINRLFESMKLMRMQHEFSQKEVISWIADLIYANNLHEDCYIRCAASVIGTGGIDTSGPVLISIDAFSQGRKANYDKGIKVCISSWGRISDIVMPPRLKCIANYQNGRLATLQAKTDGYDNTLLLNQAGKLAEAPTACVFLVKDKQLITPSVTSGILESITRDFLLRISKDIGISTVVREVDRTECYLAKEAFLCGTGCEILPIISIDGYMLGEGVPGEITKTLACAYEDIARGKNKNYLNFLTALNFKNKEGKDYVWS